MTENENINMYDEAVAASPEGGEGSSFTMPDISSFTIPQFLIDYVVLALTWLPYLIVLYFMY